MTVLTYVLAALITVATATGVLLLGWRITRHQPKSSIIIRACWGVMAGSMVLLFVVACTATGNVAQSIVQASALSLGLGGGGYVLTVAVRKRIEHYGVHPGMIAALTIFGGLFGSVGVYSLVDKVSQQVSDPDRYSPIYTASVESFWSGVGVGAAGMFLLAVLITGTIWLVRSIRRGDNDYPVVETIAAERNEIMELLRSR